MSQGNLRQIWASLDAPPDGPLKFTAAALGDGIDLRLGRSADGPALLIALSEPRLGDVPIELRNLSVRPNLLCRVQQDGVEHEGLFTVCMCTTGDANLHSLFLEALQLVVGHTALIAADGIHDVIAGLVELFRSLSQAPLTSILGLWGELLIINLAADPEGLISAWHQLPNDRFDFAMGNERLEVKTAARLRRHKFHLPQLLVTDLDTFVASVVTESSSAGATIQDLVQQIVDRAGPQVAGALMHALASALGRDLPGWSTMRYDVTMAERSVCYFSAGQIPRPEVNDARISDVRFVADMTDVPPTALPGGRLFGAVTG